MRYRIDFATITRMVQEEQGNLPLIPSLENLLWCIGLNKKNFYEIKNDNNTYTISYKFCWWR